jgi:hypothetical protein
MNLRGGAPTRGDSAPRWAAALSRCACHRHQDRGGGNRRSKRHPGRPALCALRRPIGGKGGASSVQPSFCGANCRAAVAGVVHRRATVACLRSPRRCVTSGVARVIGAWAAVASIVRRCAVIARLRSGRRCCIVCAAIHYRRRAGRGATGHDFGRKRAKETDFDHGRGSWQHAYRACALQGTRERRVRLCQREPHAICRSWSRAVGYAVPTIARSVRRSLNGWPHEGVAKGHVEGLVTRVSSRVRTRGPVRAAPRAASSRIE